MYPHHSFFQVPVPLPQFLPGTSMYPHHSFFQVPVCTLTTVSSRYQYPYHSFFQVPVCTLTTVSSRYQYPYHGYPPMYHQGLPHNVPAFYPPNYSPGRRSKKLSKEKSAFLVPTSPNKRTNHRSPENERTNHQSPEKSSFSSANKSSCSTSTFSSRDSTQNRYSQIKYM